MKILIAVILAILVLEVLALLRLRRHGKVLARTVSACPDCGGKTAVTPDPPNSRLVVQCQNANCGQTFSHSVRASALSLFGAVQLFLAILSGIGGVGVARALGYELGVSICAGLVGLILGGAVARFLMRGLALTLLKCKLSPMWQEEIVSHLTPPPFLKSRSAVHESGEDLKHSPDPASSRAPGKMNG